MPTSEPSLRPIRLWLWSVAALVFLMVIVGGATRLTESGLSIVEWKPVTGTLPPLTQAEWQAEFEKYQAIPQYQLVNRGMSLAQFKTIFWWEWGHRLLGRLVGAAFLIPFLWFLWRGAIRPGLRGRLWAIFALGGVQGGVGWWMVASGLADRIHVSHYRLAFHLTLACLIYAAVVWTAERLDARAAPTAPRIRAGAILLAILTLVQIYLGALVAGLRAGLIHDTWPLIEGRLIPPSAELFFAEPWWVNLFENALTVQFDHRMAGYLLWIAALAHAADAWRHGRAVFARALLLFGAVTVQAALGVFTLLHHVPLLLALAHQGMAMIVLTIAVVHWERVSPAPEARGQAAFAGGQA